MGGNDRHTRTLAPEQIARLREESARHELVDSDTAMDDATVTDTAFVHDKPPGVDDAALADAALANDTNWDDLAIPEDPPEQAEDRLVSRSRTDTVQDPLTAALLAEVTREARTQEFDPGELAKTIAEAETASEKKPDLAHPALKRRDG